MLDLKNLKYTLQDNALFIGTWLLALVTVLGINISNTQSLSFVGVTDSKEVNINLKHAVVIEKIHVLPGQRVVKGQILAELDRPDLVKQLNEVSHQLEQLHNQLNLNESLNESLKSIKEDERENDNALTIQIRSLENQYELLQKESEELKIFAQFDGHIGFVNYKAGESVSPFTPILTMHQKTPTFVRGYVHESIMDKIKIGSTIKISALNSGRVMKSKVTSVGTRIIEFPERFRRSIDQKIWGREIGIKLSPKNSFILGEKVFLELLPNETFDAERELANEFIEREENYQRISVPSSVEDKQELEPSGLVYLPGQNKFILISDDTHESEPHLFTLSPEGVVSESVQQIQGLGSIKDMEAIAQDETGKFYVASSQSADKDGDIPKDRRRLVRFIQNSDGFFEDKKTDLLKNLSELAVLYPEENWVEILKKENLIEDEFIIKMDVEGLIVKNDTAFLGLRSTFSEGDKLVILKIEQLDRLLREDDLLKGQVSISHKIDIAQGAPIQGISDMTLIGNELYFLTAYNSGQEQGSLYKIPFDENESSGEPVKAEKIKVFNEHKPEGIAYNSLTSELYIVFESNHSKKSYFVKVTI